MAEDKKPEHQHDFDGIEELDNDLPRWWLGIFWVTIAVAVFYWPYYHMMHPEKLPEAKYEAEMAELETQKAAQAAQAATEPSSATTKPPLGSLSEKELQKDYETEHWQEQGAEIFKTYCQACHLADGGGQIGPNLTDDYYIHGGTLSDIRDVITNGVPEKGMVAWSTTLKPEQIRHITYYVRSLRGTTPTTAKAPEGKKVDESGAFIDE